MRLKHINNFVSQFKPRDSEQNKKITYIIIQRFTKHSTKTRPQKNAAPESEAARCPATSIQRLLCILDATYRIS